MVILWIYYGCPLIRVRCALGECLMECGRRMVNESDLSRRKIIALAVPFSCRSTCSHAGMRRYFCTKHPPITHPPSPITRRLEFFFLKKFANFNNFSYLCSVVFHTMH